MNSTYRTRNLFQSEIFYVKWLKYVSLLKHKLAKQMFSGAFTWNHGDSEAGIMLVDESRAVKSDETIGNVNRRWYCHSELQYFTYLPSFATGCKEIIGHSYKNYIK